MKKTFKAKAISIILSLILLLQIAPLSAFADETAVSENDNLSATVAEELNEIPNILCEDENKRTEFTKEYLLEDGSYYSITSPTPLHSLHNGEWIDIYPSLEDNSQVSTVEEAVENIQSSTTSTYSLQRSSVSEYQDSSIIINALDCSQTPGGGYLFGDYAGILMKPTSVGDYINKNRIITYAGLSMYCSFDIEDTNPLVLIYEADYEWTTDSIPEECGNETKIIDSLNLETIGVKTWDITDLYSRWDRGVTVNNGFYFYNSTENYFMISAPYFVVRYIEVEKNDMDFTYHSLDMGDAGILYINDCTGAIRIEQQLLDLKSSNSGLCINRTYDSMLPSYENFAGIGFSFNYESRINLTQQYAEWTMVNGNVVKFITTNPLIENDDYRLWTTVNDVDNDNNTFELWIKNSEINNLGNYSNNIDYRNLYIIANGYKFCFNQSGKLVNVYDSTSNALIASIIYAENRIFQIKDTDGTYLEFEYVLSADIGYNYISKISAKNASEETIMLAENQPLTVSFSTSYDSSTQTTTQSITFSDGDSVSYSFDFYGKLLNILDEKGNYYKITYATAENGSMGNRITGYKEYYPGNTSYTSTENDEPNKSLSIDCQNTYQRKFINEIGKEEIFHYDRNFNLIVHRDTEGVYTCVDYDVNDMISSYTFGESDNTFILNNSFEEKNGKTIKNWTKKVGSSNIDRDNDVKVSGNYSLLFESENGFFNCTATQDVLDPSSVESNNSSKFIFQADRTYVIGGWGMVKDAFPKENSFFGIKIDAAPVPNGGVSEITENDYVECVTLDFDTCANDEWQFRMLSFKLDEDSVLRIKLVCEEQINSLYFDDIVLYESKETKTDLNGVVTSSPIVYSYNDDCTINSETMTWVRDSDDSISMGTSYEYQNGKLSEYKDINNNSTYYTYNSRTGMISGVGHTKDENGVLTDVTSIRYDADSLLLSTNQIIRNVESNQEVILSTNYTRDFGEIVEVEHNGFSYFFDYNDDGTLESVYTDNSSLTNPNYMDNRIDYSYDSNGELSIIDYSNNFRVKYISTKNDNNEKTVTIQCYSTNSDSTDKELLKSYTYDFNSDGKLESIYDSETGLTIIYDDDNYSICDNGSVIYQKSVNSDGSTDESYSQAYFNSQNNTNEDTIATSSSVIIYDDNNIKNSTSNVNVEKNVNDFVSSFNYTRRSAIDYFNRIESKETVLNYQMPDNKTGSIAISTDYDYQMIDEGKTSGLISDYSSTVYNNIGDSATELSAYNRKYEYDSKGNIKFIYTELNGTVSPKNYYEYDNANQLITEIDFEKGLSAHYIYNAGGNLTAKKYYNFSELVFDLTNREIISLGSLSSSITYEYDNVWTDRLVKYNDTSIDEKYRNTVITYDKMGNPLNYIGINHDNAVVTGTLEWSGDLLTAFETANERYVYQYDANGYRTAKTVYEKDTDSNSEEYWKEIYTLRYIWDNGVLTGMLYSSVKSDGTRYDEQNINLIYDEEGSPIGYITMLGVPYFFSKDINENVLSLIYTDGSKLCSFTYDSWGLPQSTFYGDNFIAEIVARMTAIFCPVTYHGYLYDYETGLYFNKGRCFSPSWGRYLNPEDPISLTESSTNPLDANLYLFCNNNTINNVDKSASWSRNYIDVEWTANGFNVEMSKIFSSRAFCSVFAGQIIKTYGSWDFKNGYNYQGMNSLRIASDLFAHCIGKYAQSAINKVNTCWGDGWILNNSKSNVISVRNDDENAWKYEKIWFAANALKAYAQKDGIYIVL